MIGLDKSIIFNYIYLACPKLIIVDHGGLNFFWTTHQQQLGWKGWLHLMKSNCVHSNSFSFENEWVEMQLVCFFSIQCHEKSWTLQRNYVFIIFFKFCPKHYLGKLELQPFKSTFSS